MKGYTIQHSINLLEKKIEESGGGSGGSTTASDVSYDNTSSGLTADDVQDAIDELNTAIRSIDSGVHYSTTERVIGKWIDGRDVYQVAVALESALTVSQTDFTDTPISIPDIDLVIGGRAIRTGNRGIICCDFGIKANTTTVMIRNSTGYSIEFGIGSILIIEYVKTAPVSNTRKKTSK